MNDRQDYMQTAGKLPIGDGRGFRHCRCERQRKDGKATAMTDDVLETNHRRPQSRTTTATRGGSLHSRLNGDLQYGERPRLQWTTSGEGDREPQST
jgi:hypothetical protein